MCENSSYEILKSENKDLKNRLDSAQKELVSVNTINARTIEKLKANLVHRTLAEERALSVLKVSPNPIVVYDMEGKVQFLNGAFTRVFGWSLGEKIGKKIDFVPKENLSETIVQIKKMLTGEKVEFQTRRHTKNGQTLDVEVSAGSFIDNQNNVIGTFVILRDITKRKISDKKIEKLNLELVKRTKDLESLNRDLEQAVEHAQMMTQKAEAAAKAKAQFLANMSHEIRTPMNGVTGMTDLLLDTDLTDEQFEFATAVQTSSDALLSLINDILDFSKIEAGKLDMEEIDFNLRSTIETLSDVMAIKAYGKGIEFASLIPEKVPCFLKGDPGRLRQILTNLAGNAIKFVDKGEVSIVVDLEKDTTDTATLLFKVNDTGIGIPEDKLTQLFESFTQVDASTTRKYGGTGLGLTISKQLSELMGGQIGVESKEGEGSTFWFTAVFKKQLEHKPQDPIIPSDIQGTNILIVDDVSINRRVFKEYLKAWNCRFDEADDGKTALIKLKEAVEKKDPYHVAILDMQMPEMTGETLGRIIKEDPVLKDTCLVMATSIGQSGDAKKMEDIGFAAYLAKPLKKRILFDCLRIVLRQTDDRGKTPLEEIITSHVVKETILSEESMVPKLKVLLAEDNIINQKVASNMLRKMGYAVEIANNGQEAVRKFKEKAFDLILMDGQMPILGGIEAAKMIRLAEEDANAKQIPIIAVTANAMKGDRECFLAAGMNDYISKPLKRDSLEKLINKILQ